jgi:glycosyltransferase involved in cell wall biosynthesis
MTKSLPFISCICPTYKRPELLRNALACFETQNYPKDRCELIILDDAGQFSESQGDNWRLISTDVRYPSLPEKFNHLVSLCNGELIAVWEDDDIFLPWNLSDVAESHLSNHKDFYMPENVWCTSDQPFGCVRIHDTRDIFHSSWRFTRKIFDKVDGYPETSELAFDIGLRDRLLAATGGRVNYGQAAAPSYVYRWGNGYWHGSGHGAEGFASLWDYVGSLPVEPQGPTYGKFDHETELIMDLTSQYRRNL